MSENRKIGRPKKIDFLQAQRNKEILSGLVKIAERGIDEDDERHLIVECGGKQVIIEKNEVEPLPFNQSITRMVGTEMKFIVTDYAEEVGLIFGSNKQAIQMLKEPILNQLMNGEEMTGTITHIVKHGAYVSMGLVSGLLKNVNFSDDGTTVADHYKEGEYIKVKYLKTSERGNILLEAVKKVQGNSTFGLKDFERNQIVSGRVVKVCDTVTYVNIAPKLDCLCAYPEIIANLQEGTYVRVRIIKVFHDTGRVRGAIIGVL